jgi:hypothetical protein
MEQENKAPTTPSKSLWDRLGENLSLPLDTLVLNLVVMNIVYFFVRSVSLPIALWFPAIVAVLLVLFYVVDFFAEKQWRRLAASVVVTAAGFAPVIIAAVYDRQK